jgi:VWFA-related protein
VILPRRALLPLALVPAAWPQIPLNPPRAPSLISVDVRLVNVLFTVRDRRGGYVKNLEKQDFEVRDEGRRQEITHFAREVDTPLTVALLIDVSGSVSNIIEVEKAAAARFFSEVLRPGDKACLAGFSGAIAVWQELTSSVPQLHTALEGAGWFPVSTAMRGGTLLYDAVNLVAHHKLRPQAGRKTMIVISDGVDHGSRVDLEAASRSAQEADAVVYAIHYEDREGGGHGALRKLSRQTGGRAFKVTPELPLEHIFDTIREEMRSQYAIGYRPPDESADGRFRRLEVKTLTPGLNVQARTGYYAAGR